MLRYIGNPTPNRLKLFFPFLLAGLSIIALGQDINSRIDRKDLKYYIKVLSSDTLEGRGTGTEGERKAQRFISERYKKLGLIPFDSNGYLQKYSLKQVYWGKVYLKVGDITLKNFENMVLQGGHTENSEIEKEVVFGGSGSDEELDKIDIKGKLVLVFVKNLRAYYDVNKRIERRGAYGLIIANPKSDTQFNSIKSTYKEHALAKRFLIASGDSAVNMLFQRLDSIKLVNTLLIPNSQIGRIGGLSEKQLEKLMDDGKIEDAPTTKVRVMFEKKAIDIESANVVGVIKGSSDSSIIVSAHYDHLGKTNHGYYPGADDNASGTSALLELAEEFSEKKELKYNIIFVATSGEENGLLGSLYYVNSPFSNPEKVLYNLNMDMIARRDEKHTRSDYLYCIGTDQSEKIKKLLRQADESFKECYFDYTLDTSEYPYGIFTRSDQYNFYKKGVVSIHFFTGLHLDYHQPTDTFNKIDYKSLENRVQLIGRVIEIIQTEGDVN